MTFKQWLNKTFYCSFWECEPVQDGTWWRSRTGTLIVLPDFEGKCAKCGRPVTLNVQSFD
jgi:hypothetical protein